MWRREDGNAMATRVPAADQESRRPGRPRRPESRGAALGLAVTALLTVLYALLLRPDPGTMGPLTRWLRVFELKTLDVRMALRGARAPSGQVLIVEIDERSIAALGRYPWDRRIHGQLVERLAALGARAIGLDLLLSEPSQPDEDRALASAMEKAGNVYLAAHVAELPGPPSNRREGAPVRGDFSYQRFLNPPATAARGSGIARGTAPSSARRIPALVMPIPPLAEAAAGIGLSELGAADPDQVFRWLPMAVEADEPGRYYPPFAFVIALGARGGRVAEDAVLDFGRGVRTRQLGTVPTDPSGHLLVDFLGGARTFPYVSYLDVLEGRIGPEQVSGRIVLVGATAKGLADFRSTPLAVMPGVEVHATVIDNVLSGRFIVLPGWERLASVAALGSLLALTLSRLDARRGLVAAAAVLAGYVVAVQLAFVQAGRWLHLFYPLAASLIVTAVQLSYGYLTQERQKLAIRRTFQKYVPPEVVEQLLRDPDRVALGGERRTISVLFSDIRGFTSLSEQMKPEEVVRFLNGYFAVMTPIIYRHGGTVDKFEGDGIMALFGAPIHHPDHAVRAVRAALDMQGALEEVQQQWKSAPGLPLRIGVGIATGDVVVGNIGSPERLNYTAVGDTVNLAARLQDLTKELGAEILIGESTYEAARDVIEAVPIPGTRVRGRSQAVTIYRVTGLRQARPLVEADAAGPPAAVRARGRAGG